jgi:UDP-N-acetyl-D-glucosamine dehydrogenase
VSRRSPPKHERPALAAPAKAGRTCAALWRSASELALHAEVAMTTTAPLDMLLARIESGSAVCGVIGLGYVGLPLAVEIAEHGFRVLGFDVAMSVVDGVNAGRSHIADIPSTELARHVEAGRIEATMDTARLSACDAISICVPTPLSKTRDPDVSYVVAATSAVATALRSGQLIVLESTTYPGTTREVMLPALEAGGLRAGTDFFLCFSPERVDPGNPMWGVRNTPKVIGGITAACLRAGQALYGRVMERVMPVSSTEAAELTKLLENTFRAVNIALVNEMAQVSDRLNVDVFEVIEAAASKPFGFMRFNPGPGIGGHCIPLDPHYLAWKMRTLNYKTRLIDLAGEVNSEMPHFVVNKVQDALNAERRSLNGSRILILGVAYKKDVDDIRESPALDILRLLEGKGAIVSYHDPHVAEVHEEGAIRRSVPFTAETLGSVDAVVLVTDHSDVDYDVLAGARIPIVDTRNVLRGRGGANVVGLSGSRVGGAS